MQVLYGSFSGHIVVTVENSTVSKESATCSSLPQSGEGHVIVLYQCGPPGAGPINPSASYVNSREDQNLPLCHSGLPTPPEAVCKEPKKDLQVSVLIQAERSPLAPQIQSRTNTSRGRTPSAKKNSSLDRPHVLWAPPYTLPPFLCVGHHSLPSPSAALFYVWDPSSTAISSSSPLWLPGGPCCHRPF